MKDLGGIEPGQLFTGQKRHGHPINDQQRLPVPVVRRDPGNANREAAVWRGPHAKAGHASGQKLIHASDSQPGDLSGAERPHGTDRMLSNRSGVAVVQCVSGQRCQALACRMMTRTARRHRKGQQRGAAPAGAVSDSGLGTHGNLQGEC